MKEKIDARGLACPQPVILTKNALEEIEEGIIEVIVGNKAASENVARFARSAGCEVKITEEGTHFLVVIEKGRDSKKIRENSEKTIAIFVSSDTIGRGNDDLGKILSRAFFPTLLEIQSKPNRIIFMNSGVKLTVEGSEVLDKLQELEKSGVELLVCGTCLDFFRIKDKISVGRISNMFEIVSNLIDSDRIVTI